MHSTKRLSAARPVDKHLNSSAILTGSKAPFNLQWMIHLMLNIHRISSADVLPKWQVELSKAVAAWVSIDLNVWFISNRTCTCRGVRFYFASIISAYCSLLILSSEAALVNLWVTLHSFWQYLIMPFSASLNCVRLLTCFYHEIKWWTFEGLAIDTSIGRVPSAVFLPLFICFMLPPWEDACNSKQQLLDENFKSTSKRSHKSTP